MAYKAKRIFFFLLAICFSLQTHARDSKFFSKISKQNHESISLSPAMAPTLAPSPSPEAEVIEHGYGLYGRDSHESYEYPPTTTNPTKFGEDKYVSNEEFSNMNHYQESGKGKGNGVEEKQGMSDTRFLENGKQYYNPNQDVKDESGGYFHKSGKRNGNGYEGERQGMSDTRFLENGKYYYDPNQDVKDESRGYFHKSGKRNANGYEGERQGMSDTRFLENGKYFHDINEEKNGHFNTNNYEDNVKFEEENNGHFNTNNYEDNEKFEEENNHHFNTNNYENQNENENEDFVDEKQGMSDTRFLENGKYYYDVNEEAPNKGKYGRFEVHNNGNENENKNEEERLGMSDTRFLENGKYYYDVNNEKSNNNENNNNKFGVEDVGFHNNNNVEYANSYHGYGNGNEYENEERGRGYNYPQNEYHVKEGRRGYNGNNKPKKFPNVYDTMEEYDREQGYIDGQDQYVP